MTAESVLRRLGLPICLMPTISDTFVVGSSPSRLTSSSNLIDDVGQGAAILAVLHVSQRITAVQFMPWPVVTMRFDYITRRPRRSRPAGMPSMTFIKAPKRLLVGFSLDGVEHDIDKGTRFNIVDCANGAAGDCLRFSARDAFVTARLGRP